MTAIARSEPAGDLIEAPEAVDARLLSILAEKDADPDFWSSKSRDRTDSAHSIFQYPAMMVPVVQRRLLGAVLKAQPNLKTLYDPFVGSGTSLVSGMHYGLNVYGNDVNPLAVLISRVRTAATTNDAMAEAGARVVAAANADTKTRIEAEMVNRTKWFHDEVALELSRLRRAIRAEKDLWVRQFMWVTLAETVRLTSNDRTSTYKLHARPAAQIAERIPSPMTVFAELIVENATSFANFREKLAKIECLRANTYVGDTDVRISDTRNAQTTWGAVAPFDLLMTSPPYGDNLTTVTYGQHSYLPLQWIDFSDIDADASKDALRSTQEIDRRSLGGAAWAGNWTDEALLAASPRLAAFREKLPTDTGDGRSRLTRFYRDFGSSLDSILGLMKPDGYMIWTVGNRNICGHQVPTDEILGELLEGLNCKVLTTLTRRIHFKRMPDRNASSATMREEKILLVRKRQL